MPSIGEATGQQSEIKAVLDAGIEQISEKQTVVFQRYAKFVFSQDGFVFWVATGEKMEVTGSLHYATDRLQDEDQTIGANQVLLTSESEITEFNTVNPLSMWIGAWPLPSGAPTLQVAFAQRGNYFKQADIWHYAGFAVYPALSSQIVNDASDLPQGPIVSNSLPIWLTLTDFQGGTVPVYPSFLVPDNVVPPYVVVHISDTEALSAAPYIGPWPGIPVPNSGASPLNLLIGSQQARDTVVLTLYGFTNTTAWQYYAALYEASENGTAPFGFANSPMITDVKRPQVEIAALAQKKTLTILANYDQSAADAIARRLILSAGFYSFEIIGCPGVRGLAHLVQDVQRMTANGTVNE